LLKGQHVDGDVLALGFNGGAGVARGDEDLLTRGSWATFQARACSRPPLPMIKTFMSKPRMTLICCRSGLPRMGRNDSRGKPLCSKLAPRDPCLVTEVAHAGEDHGDAGFVGGNDFASRIEPPGWITA
jgi:hypothetical protein